MEKEKLKVGDWVRIKRDTTAASLYNVMTIKVIIGTKVICNYTDREMNSCEIELKLDELEKYSSED